MKELLKQAHKARIKLIETALDNVLDAYANAVVSKALSTDIQELNDWNDRASAWKETIHYWQDELVKSNVLLSKLEKENK